MYKLQVIQREDFVSGFNLFGTIDAEFNCNAALGRQMTPYVRRTRARTEEIKQIGLCILIGRTSELDHSSDFDVVLDYHAGMHLLKGRICLIWRLIARHTLFI